MQEHCQTVTRWCRFGPSAIIAFLGTIPYQGISCVAAVTYGISRNLARQISRDLHADRFAMVLTAGFYSDSRAHNVRKGRVVKYIVV